MIEITITCDKCGAKKTFEPTLTSYTEVSDGGFSVCSLNTPREVSVLENVKKNAMMAGLSDDHWHSIGTIGSGGLVCPKCWAEYIRVTDEYEADLKKALDAEDKVKMARAKAVAEWFGRQSK